MDNLYSEAMDYALTCLSYKEYSSGQLREKMVSRHYTSTCIDDVIHKLQEYKYIDDERYARMIVHSHQHKYGKKRIEEYLARRYISRDIIERAMETITPEHEADIAQKKIDQELQKLRNRYDISTDKHKIFKSLLHKLVRLGIDYELSFRMTEESMRHMCYSTSEERKEEEI